jgi:hypothetical protein
VASNVFVQAFVPEPPIEALDEAVLHRLAGRDVVPLDADGLRPAQHGVRGQLGVVVADDRAGPAMICSSQNRLFRIVRLLAGPGNVPGARRRRASRNTSGCCGSPMALSRVQLSSRTRETPRPAG